MDKYQKVKVLGKGSFGSAILIKRKSDGALFVVKEVSLSKMSKKEREEARNECAVLQQLHHPNIVRYVEQFENRNNLYIVMEYCDDGDLSGKIKQCRGRMKESTVMYYFSQISLAMEYLHSRHILHRDIKTMNVFLMKNGAVKLGDFGISTVLRNTMGMANTVCGTPYYFSPELCRNKPYNNKSDIWAMGVLLYECATGGRHPFDGQSMNQLMQRIVKSSYPPLSSQYSSEFRKMVDWCLQKDPARRPSIKQLLAYPLIRQALETLEENLMLATQCRVRLKDIIDFDSAMDNHVHDGQHRAAGGASPSHSPSASPAPSGANKLLPAGVSPGQAAAMAMAKQPSQAPSPAPPTAATPSAARPTSPGALVSPKPGARQVNVLLDKNGIVNRTPPSSPGAAAAAAVNHSPALHSPSAQARGEYRQSPQPTAERHSEDQVVVAGNRDPRGGPRSNVNLAAGDAANRGDRFSANMNRVDAIIAKYGHDLNPKAKETIHAYMRRKQEEYLARQKEENERLERRNELRQRELKRVLDQQRRLAQNSPQRSPSHSPRTSSAAQPDSPAPESNRHNGAAAHAASPASRASSPSEANGPVFAVAGVKAPGFGRDPRLAGAVSPKPESAQMRRMAANSPGVASPGHGASPSRGRAGAAGSAVAVDGVSLNANRIREERDRVMKEIQEREQELRQRVEARDKAEQELKQRQERNRIAMEQQRLRAASNGERAQQLRRGGEFRSRPTSPGYGSPSLGLAGSPTSLEPVHPHSVEPSLYQPYPQQRQLESPRRQGALQPLSPRHAGDGAERSPVVSRPTSPSQGALRGYSPRASPMTLEAAAAEQRRLAYLEHLQQNPETRGKSSPPSLARGSEAKESDGVPPRSNGLPPMHAQPVPELVPSTGVSGTKDVPDANFDPIQDALRVLRKRASMGVSAPVAGSPAAKHPTAQVDLTLPEKQPHRRLGAEPSPYDGMLRSPDTHADERFLSEKASYNVAMPSTLDTLRSLRDEKEREQAHKEANPYVRAESNPQLALLKQRLSNAPLPALSTNPRHRRTSSAATDSAAMPTPAARAKAPRMNALSLSELKAPSRQDTRQSAQSSPAPSPTSSPSRRTGVGAGGGTAGGDAYAEMLQHLKDLLQKRRVVQAGSAASPAATAAVSPNRSSPSPTMSAGLTDAPRSPPSLAYTKAQNAPPITIEFSEDEDADALDVPRDADDDDFEDAVPLSPVRCTEINDARTKASGGRGEHQGIYGADAFLGGADRQMEEEEELGDDGYTGYYKLPSPTSLWRE